MPLAFRYSVVTKDTPNGSHYTGIIPDEDADAIRLFLQCEEELAHCQYLTSGSPLRAQINWTADSGYSQPELPPAGHIREFLHLMRPFLLENEVPNALRMLNRIKRHYRDPDLSSNLDSAKQAYTGKLIQDQFRLEVGGLVVNSDEALKLWLNAFEYHTDVDKRALLGSLTAEVPLDVMKVLFLMLLVDKVNVIRWLGMFLRTALHSAQTGHTIRL